MYREIRIQLYRDIEEERHFHSEMEIVTVIDGTLKATVGDQVFLLRKEDILLINSGFSHEISAGEDSIICVVRYPFALVSDLMGNGNCIFNCNTVAEPDGDYRELHAVFHKLIFAYIHQTHKTKSLLFSLMFGLLDCIVEYYQISDQMASMKENETDIRLQQIFQYVSRNYQTGLSLAQIAEHFYVSTSTLSRFLKKQTGIYFSEYVNQIKCRQAAQDLICTEKNITRLAVDCGFSSSSAFHKVFREIYGMSPSDYRKNYRQEKTEQEVDPQWLEKLRKDLAGKHPDYLDAFEKNEQDVSLSIDSRVGKCYEKNWNQVMNVGSLYGLTMANIQFHTLRLVENLGFPYVRVWSIFSEKMMLTDGIHIGNYNYDIMDTVLDFLVSHHIYPFLDLGRRPNAIIRSEIQPVFFGAEYIDFKSRRAWEALFADFISHIVKRYGKEEVSHWIFEVSHDPFHMDDNQYYESDTYDMMDVWQYVWNTVKAVCPEAQVGGPGCVPGWHDEKLNEFLLRSRENHAEPDFVSCIMFPYEDCFLNSQFVRFRSARENYEQDHIRRMRDMLDKEEMEDCKLYLTEWNNTISNRNFLNDSCFRAAYMTRKISEMWDGPDLICPWIGSDWVSGYYDIHGVANGGNGFLTKDSIRKPVYFALQFLNYLGNILIEKNDYCIVTKRENEFYLLCWNFKAYAVNYYIGEEQMDRPEKLEGIFEDEELLRVSITLEHLPHDVLYLIKRRTVNSEHGSLLNEWEKFQYDTNLTGSDVKYLRESCFPEMSMEKQRAAGGTLLIRRILKPHEISVFHIYESED